MARVQKMTDAEIGKVLDTFVTASRAKYDSYAYPVGYLQSVLVGLVAELPAAKQQATLDMIRKWKPL